MLKRTLIATSAVLSTALILSGVSVAQQVICNPVCSPTRSNSPGNSTSDRHRGQGLRNANEVAGDHGFQGRDNARMKQDAHRPGGSGVPDPTPVPVPVPLPPPSGGDTTGGTTLPPAPTPSPGGLPTCGTLC
jgi:hypothetical protein